MRALSVLGLAGAVGFAVLVAVQMVRVASRTTDWRIGQLLGGPTSVECVKEPHAVDAFVLAPEPRHGEGDAIGAHVVVRGPVRADDATVKELAAILLDADTYDWQRAKSDPIRPTFGLRFARDASRLDVAISFTSDMLVAHRGGRPVGVEDIDAARPRLLAIARRLFPDEPAFAETR